MKTLYLECKMGAAGDMLTAALLELLPDKQVFIDKMNSLGIPGVEVSAAEMTKCGINGTHMIVKVNGMEEHEYFHALKHAHSHDHEHEAGENDHSHTHGDHEHAHVHTHDHEHTHEHMHEADVHSHLHEHDHSHTHDHVHTGMHEIGHIIADLDISDKVRSDVTEVYRLIAEAESHAHGIPVDEVHFHEVGAMDAITDITGVCLLMEMIAPENIIASPVHVGSGHVHCTHGTLPVPAPTTAYILRGIPTYSDGTARGELCTPTGAALLKHFVSEFCEMPVMTVSDIGYGMGMKDFDQANCIRAMLGECSGPAAEQHSADTHSYGSAEDGSGRDTVVELACNIDDMTPEAVGFAVSALLDEGALDVWTEAIGMKKNRPAVKLCCLCRPGDRDKIVRAVFKNTTTIGIREYECGRYTLTRSASEITTPYGNVRSKVSRGYGVEREKAEYDDLAELARRNGVSVIDVLKDR